MAIMGLGGQEIFLVALFVLLFFGAKKIPELMRGLGQGINEFKNATKDVKENIENQTESPRSRLPDEFAVRIEMHLQGVMLDETTLTRSRMLSYVRMIVNLIDGLQLSREELLDVLCKRVRQHSMANRKRIDYVLRFLHQHPP